MFPETKSRVFITFSATSLAVEDPREKIILFRS